MLRSLRSPAHCILATCLACAAVLVAGQVPPAAAGERPTKIERQITVAGKMIDEMLVDSPNFLVSGREPTDGFEIEDMGALFVFEASLTGPEWDSEHGSHSWFWPWKKHNRVFVINRGHKREILMDGDQIVIKDGDVHISDGGKLRKLDDSEWDTMDEKTYRERELETYERAKAELVDALLDCGDMLTALPPGQTVRIEARLREIELPGDREVRRLTVRAKSDDLRSYSDGRLSETDMRARVEIKES
jgi:hypothetical protein